jgi:hypothetical protein
VPNNHHRRGTTAGNTFRLDEVEAFVAVEEALLRGADASVIMRSAGWRSLASKVRRMRQSMREGRSGRTPSAESPDRLKLLALYRKQLRDNDVARFETRKRLRETP